MVLENHMKLCVIELDFPEKYFCFKNWENEPKMGQKYDFSGFIEKFGHRCLLNLFCNENLFCLVCSCANPIFGKNFVSDIWAKIFLAKKIARFFNQLYLQKKPIK